MTIGGKANCAQEKALEKGFIVDILDRRSDANGLQARTDKCLLSNMLSQCVS
jgi:hypothetical protein